MKNTKGITLIALIVTIIVLIILAGISVNLLFGNNGILNKAKDASAAQKKAEIKENIGLDITAKQIETKGIVTKSDLETILGAYGTVNYNQDGTIKSVTIADTGDEIALSEIYSGEVKDITITYNKNDSNASGTMASSGATVLESTFTAPTGKRFKEWNSKTDGTGTKYEVGSSLTEDITLYAIWEDIPPVVFSQGQKVKIGNEKFYVLTANDTEEATTIELFAMYNLNKTAETSGTFKDHYMQLANATKEDTACGFSNTNYWGTETKYPLNLNTYIIPTTGENAETLAKNALLKADDYAKAVGGNLSSGRLLTYEEANTIKKGSNTDLKNMLWGKENKQGTSDIYYLWFWLGSALYTSNVYYVYGSAPGIYNSNHDESNYYGVRPVITVSKSIVEEISE